ncbi:LuxR C-terminal-related transcriptional regulator [Rhodococcus koreensis]
MKPTALDASVLGTRFTPALPPRGLVSRDRLLDTLQSSAEARLTLIHAPAGFGKSALAAQWRERLLAAGGIVAWLSIDGDEHVGSFLAHVIAAVGRVAPDLVGDLPAMLNEVGIPAERYVLTSLINAVQQAGRPLLLIIDDWHRVTTPATVAALEYLIVNGGSTLRVLVTSRSRSGLPLSRMLISDDLCEIDSTQLRFDEAESRSLLVGLGANDDESIGALIRSTDGWVAALKLAALSMRGHDSPTPSSTVGRRAVGEFLAENVLDALDPEVLDFMLASCLPERICGPLADALTGRADGMARLEDVERRDLFLDRLDDEAGWFRYHHLFADFLRHRLAAADPGRLVDLHVRASNWFAENGMVGEAVDHAMAAGRTEAAIDLVEREAMKLIEDSRMVAVLRLVDRLPAGAVGDRPRLLMAISWANCLLQRSTAAQLALDQLRYSFTACDGPLDRHEQQVEADVVQACIDVFADRLNQVDDLVGPAIADHGRHRPFVVGVAANLRTVVLIHQQDLVEAERLQAWARNFHDQATGRFPAVYGRCLAGVAASSQWETSRAEELLRSALVLARESAGAHSHAAQLAAALLAELLYERDRVDDAERLSNEAARLGSEGGLVEFMSASYRTRAHIRDLRGARTEALELLAEGTEAAVRLELPRLQADLTLDRIRLMLRAGDVGRARTLMQSIPSSAGRSGGVSRSMEQARILATASVESAEGRHASAVAELTTALEHADPQRNPRAETTVRIALATALQAAGRTQQAFRTLVPALQLGARVGLCRSFLDGGPDLIALLRRGRESIEDQPSSMGTQSFPSLYLTELVDRSGAGATAYRHLSPALKQLSAREIEILRLVDQGYTNARIAAELSLTINTVKWHLKNVNIKLGVSNRTESVAIVRQSRLLG